MLGDAGVGKTCLALRAVGKGFGECPQTLGAGWEEIEIPVDCGGVAQVKLWDTAGQERHRALLPIYARDSDAAVLVYDVSGQNTADDLKGFVDCIPDGCKTVVVVGNKSDLPPDERPGVDKGYFESLGKTVGFFETSAKTGAGVEEVMRWIGEKLVNSPSCRMVATHVELPGPNEEKTCPC